MLFLISSRPKRTLCKIPKFHLISWYGNLVERHSFLPDYFAKTVPFHKISTPENWWIFGILRNGSWTVACLNQLNHRLEVPEHSTFRHFSGCIMRYVVKTVAIFKTVVFQILFRSFEFLCKSWVWCHQSQIWRYLNILHCDLFILLEFLHYVC